jgi:hypothetical protein
MGLIPAAPNPDNEGTEGLVNRGSSPSSDKRVEMPFERLFEELTIMGAAEVRAMRFGRVPGGVGGANGLAEENVGLTGGRFRGCHVAGPIGSPARNGGAGATGLDGGEDPLRMPAIGDFSIHCWLPAAEAAGTIGLSG